MGVTGADDALRALADLFGAGAPPASTDEDPLDLCLTPLLLHPEAVVMLKPEDKTASQSQAPS